MTKELTAIIDAVDGNKNKGGRPRKEEIDEPKGKKAQKQAEAEKVAAGRFAARPGPPKLVANNG